MAGPGVAGPGVARRGQVGRGHEARDRLMGKEGEKRIIRLCLVTLAELGYEHKTDRAIRRAIAFKLRGPGIGFTQVEFDRDDRRDGEAAG